MNRLHPLIDVVQSVGDVTDNHRKLRELGLLSGLSEILVVAGHLRILYDNKQKWKKKTL